MRPRPELPLAALVSLLAGGCAASRPVSGVLLGAGGAALASQLSHGDPALTAAGAAGGVLVSEGLHYLARRETARAYTSGYEQGRSDAVRQQYWLYVGMQRAQAGESQVRLYPVRLPEQRVDGAVFQPSVRLLRLEE